MKGGEAGAEAEFVLRYIISGRISRGQLLVTSSPSMIKIFLSFSFTSCSCWKFVTMSEYVQKNQPGYSIPASPAPFAVGSSSLI